MDTDLRPAAIADRLLALLQQQREALLRTDPAAVADLEAGTREIEQAVAALAGIARHFPDRLAGTAPAALTPLQDALQVNQATLVNFAAGNRRALNALFGEPTLYSK